MFYTIITIITIIAFLLLIVAVYYNKFQFAIIKINEAEENTELYLKRKKDLILRCIPIIKEELKLKTFLEEIDKIDDKTNHFKMNDILTDCYQKLFQKVDDNDKLYESENLVSILEELNDNEVILTASVKFYNDTVVDFNKLILSFPSNIIRLFLGYKKKEFYSHEKREIFEILKEEKKSTS